MVNNFLLGLHYSLEGFHLLIKPGLKRFSLIPLLINIIFFSGLFALLWHFTSIAQMWFASHLPLWLHWLLTFLWILFFISFFLIFIFAFVTVANLITSPFNSLLSEKVGFLLTQKDILPRTLFETIKDIPRIIGRQLLMLGYYLPRACVCILLFFIPLVQAVAPLILFLFHAWFMTLTFLDYPTDNYRISFLETLAWMKNNKWLSFGFGVGVLITMMIPILNFFAIPAAVAAATKLWLENQT